MKTESFSKASYLYAVATIIPALLGTISISIYTRIFSTADYGYYTIVLNTVLFFTTFLTQWIQQSIQKYRAEYRRENRINEFNNYTYYLIGIIILISLILYLILLYFINMSQLNVYESYLFPSLLLTISNIIFLIQTTILQTDFKVNSYKNINVLTSIGKLILPVSIIFAISKSPVSILYGTAIAQILISIYLLKKDIKVKIFKGLLVSKEFNIYVRKFLLYGTPMIGWFVSNYLLTVSDRYLLNIMLSPHEVGIYAANYSIITAGIGLLTRPILNAAQPILMNLPSESQDDKKLIQIKNREYTKYYFLFTIPTFFYLLIFHKEVASLFLGYDFIEGSIIIPILFCALLVWNAGLFGHKGLEILGKTKLMFYIVCFSAVLNIVLNLILIPKLSYVGSALSALLSMLAYPLIVYFISKKYIKWIINFKSLFVSIISSCLATLGCFYLLKMFTFSSIINLILGAFIGGGIYLLALLIFGEIKLNNLFFHWKQRKKNK